jgi:hypothetical protein
MAAGCGSSTALRFPSPSRGRHVGRGPSRPRGQGVFAWQVRWPSKPARAGLVSGRVCGFAAFVRPLPVQVVQRQPDGCSCRNQSRSTEFPSAVRRCNTPGRGRWPGSATTPSTPGLAQVQADVNKLPDLLAADGIVDRSVDIMACRSRLGRLPTRGRWERLPSRPRNGAHNWRLGAK